MVLSFFFQIGNEPTFLERHRHISKDDNYAFTVHGQIYIVSTRRVLSRQDIGNRAILLGSPVHIAKKWNVLYHCVSIVVLWKRRKTGQGWISDYLKDFYIVQTSPEFSKI